MDFRSAAFHEIEAKPGLFDQVHPGLDRVACRNNAVGHTRVSSEPICLATSSGSKSRECVVELPGVTVISSFDLTVRGNGVAPGDNVAATCKFHPRQNRRSNWPLQLHANRQIPFAGAAADYPRAAREWRLNFLCSNNTDGQRS